MENNIFNPDDYVMQNSFETSSDTNSDNSFNPDDYVMQNSSETKKSNDNNINTNYGVTPYDDIITKASKQYGVSEEWIKSVMAAENGGFDIKPKAKSPKGAQGIMQLMPDTATALGVKNAYDPEENIMGATKLLKQLQDKYGDIEKVAAAYNAGEGNVDKYKGIPPFKETKKYVENVKKYYNELFKNFQQKEQRAIESKQEPDYSILKSIKSGAAGILTQTAGIPEAVAGTIYNALGGTEFEKDKQEVLDNFPTIKKYYDIHQEDQKILTNYVENLQKKQPKSLQTDFTDLISKNDYKGIGQKIGDLFFNQVPQYAEILALGYLTGGGTLPITLWATQSGSAQYEQIKNNPNLTPQQKAANVSLYAALEGFFEILGTGKILNRLLKSSKNVDKELIKKGLIANITKNIPQSMLEEGVFEEFPTQLGQNLTDIVTGAKEFTWDNVTNGIPESVLGGMMGGAAMTGAGNVIDKSKNMPPEIPEITELDTPKQPTITERTQTPQTQRQSLIDKLDKEGEDLTIDEIGDIRNQIDELDKQIKANQTAPVVEEQPNIAPAISEAEKIALMNERDSLYNNYNIEDIDKIIKITNTLIDDYSNSNYLYARNIISGAPNNIPALYMAAKTGIKASPQTSKADITRLKETIEYFDERYLPLLNDVEQYLIEYKNKYPEGTERPFKLSQADNVKIAKAGGKINSPRAKEIGVDNYIKELQIDLAKQPIDLAKQPTDYHRNEYKKLNTTIQNNNTQISELKKQNKDIVEPDDRLNNENKITELTKQNQENKKQAALHLDYINYNNLNDKITQLGNQIETLPDNSPDIVKLTNEQSRLLKEVDKLNKKFGIEAGQSDLTTELNAKIKQYDELNAAIASLEQSGKPVSDKQRAALNNMATGLAATLNNALAVDSESLLNNKKVTNQHLELLAKDKGIDVGQLAKDKTKGKKAIIEKLTNIKKKEFNNLNKEIKNHSLIKFIMDEGGMAFDDSLAEELTPIKKAFKKIFQDKAMSVDSMAQIISRNNQNEWGIQDSTDLMRVLNSLAEGYGKIDNYLTGEGLDIQSEMNNIDDRAEELKNEREQLVKLNNMKGQTIPFSNFIEQMAYDNPAFTAELQYRYDNDLNEYMVDKLSKIENAQNGDKINLFNKDFVIDKTNNQLKSDFTVDLNGEKASNYVQFQLNKKSNTATNKSILQKISDRLRKVFNIPVHIDLQKFQDTLQLLADKGVIPQAMVSEIIYPNINLNKIMDKVNEYFGFTNNWKETGYITIDGKLLDFSGKKFGGEKNSRGIDHREITSAFYNYETGNIEKGFEYEAKNIGMEEFINFGNIRIMPEAESINLNIKPTIEQIKQLKNFINYNNGFVIVEIGTKFTDNYFYRQYPSKISSQRIIEDINNFFDKKPIKELSEIQKLRALEIPQFLKSKDGQNVLGFIYNNEVYLNPSKATLNTPIHEFGHIWNNWCKENAPAIYNRGIELIKQFGQPYINKIKKLYAKQIEKLPEAQREAFIYDEALTFAIGDNGEAFIKNKNIYKKFMIFLRMMWNKLKMSIGKMLREDFKIKTDIENMKIEDLQNLTFQEFLDKITERQFSERMIAESKPKPEKQQYVEYQITDEKGNKITVRALPEGLDIVNGFYSPIEKTLLEDNQPSRQAKIWLKILGETKDEMVYTGLTQYLQSKKPQETVTKKELLDYIKNNRIEIVEKVKGLDVFKKNFFSESDFAKNPEKYGWDKETKKVVLKFGDNYYLQGKNVDPEDNSGDWLLFKQNGLHKDFISTYDYAISAFTDIIKYNAPKFSQKAYQLPGEKENYKEVLILLPNATLFQSGHYDDPNILAHLRMNERYIKKGIQEATQEEYAQNEIDIINYQNFLNKKYGKNEWQNKLNENEKETLYNFTKYLPKKKVLFLEEIQSDFGQAFRDKTTEIKAPYITDTNAWTKLALKYAMQHAVNSGADYISWTTGSQQIERYNEALRQNVDKIEWVRKDDDVNIIASKDNKKSFNQIIAIEGKSTVLGKEVTLDEVVGKNIAKEIRSSYNESLKKEYFEYVYYLSNKYSEANLKFSEERIIYDSEKKLKPIATPEEWNKYIELNDKYFANNQGEFTGSGLTIGGEGMKKYYGEPAEVEQAKTFTIEKIADKKFVVKDENGKELKTFDTEKGALSFKNQYGKGIVGNLVENKELFNQELTTIDIGEGEQPAVAVTDAMRQEVNQGLPQFMQNMAAEFNVSLEQLQKEFDETKAKYINTEQWLKAPNGNNSNLSEHLWVMVRTPRFKNWFGDWQNNPEAASKVVDENGEPLVVYHGTDADFNIIDRITHFGTLEQAENKKQTAKEGGNIKPFFLNIKNIKRTPDVIGNWEKLANKLKKENYDGLVYSNKFEGIGDSYIAFDGNNIKSIFNVGSFGETGDIRFMYAGEESLKNLPETEKKIARDNLTAAKKAYLEKADINLDNPLEVKSENGFNRAVKNKDNLKNQGFDGIVYNGISKIWGYQFDGLKISKSKSATVEEMQDKTPQRFYKTNNTPVQFQLVNENTGEVNNKLVKDEGKMSRYISNLITAMRNQLTPEQIMNLQKVNPKYRSPLSYAYYLLKANIDSIEVVEQMLIKEFDKKGIWNPKTKDAIGKAMTAYIEHKDPKIKDYLSDNEIKAYTKFVELTTLVAEKYNGLHSNILPEDYLRHLLVFVDNNGKLLDPESTEYKLLNKEFKKALESNKNKQLSIDSLMGYAYNNPSNKYNQKRYFKTTENLQEHINKLGLGKNIKVDTNAFAVAFKTSNMIKKQLKTAVLKSTLHQLATVDGSNGVFEVYNPDAVKDFKNRLMFSYRRQMDVLKQMLRNADLDINEYNKIYNKIYNQADKLAGFTNEKIDKMLNNLADSNLGSETQESLQELTDLANNLIDFIENNPDINNLSNLAKSSLKAFNKQKSIELKQQLKNIKGIMAGLRSAKKTALDNIYKDIDAKDTQAKTLGLNPLIGSDLQATFRGLYFSKDMLKSIERYSKYISNEEKNILNYANNILQGYKALKFSGDLFEVYNTAHKLVSNSPTAVKDLFLNMFDKNAIEEMLPELYEAAQYGVNFRIQEELNIIIQDKNVLEQFKKDPETILQKAGVKIADYTPEMIKALPDLFITLVTATEKLQYKQIIPLAKLFLWKAMVNNRLNDPNNKLSEQSVKTMCADYVMSLFRGQDFTALNIQFGIGKTGVGTGNVLFTSFDKIATMMLQAQRTTAGAFSNIPEQKELSKLMLKKFWLMSVGSMVLMLTILKILRKDKNEDDPTKMTIMGLTNKKGDPIIADPIGEIAEWLRFINSPKSFVWNKFQAPLKELVEFGKTSFRAGEVYDIERGLKNIIVPLTLENFWQVFDEPETSNFKDMDMETARFLFLSDFFGIPTSPVSKDVNKPYLWNYIWTNKFDNDSFGKKVKDYLMFNKQKIAKANYKYMHDSINDLFGEKGKQKDFFGQHSKGKDDFFSK